MGSISSLFVHKIVTAANSGYPDGAGVCQSFSDFVMAGLVRAQCAAGIESMQRINRTVFRSIFLMSFLLMVPLTAAYAFYAILRLDGYGYAYVIAASITYLATVFQVTMLGNVPMNKRLDMIDHASTEAREYWPVYHRVRTRYNHVRTIGSATTVVLYLVAAAVLSSAT